MNQKINKFACLALSGGMDSTTLLIHLLAKGYQVSALTFLYGQKHLAEVSCAKEVIAYLAMQGYPIEHHLISLDGLENLLFSSLITGGEEVPEGHYAQENMKATVVPNRNKIFISILQSTALSIALRVSQSRANNDSESTRQLLSLEEKEAAVEVVVAMGIHAGDQITYPDCRPEFIEADFAAFLAGNWQGALVSNYLPYLNFDKYQILCDGDASCIQLNIDFNEVYKRTLTSYKPNSKGVSDYKSSASVARIEAFLKLNRMDPILYADETGIVDWQTVKTHVLNILK